VNLLPFMRLSCCFKTLQAQILLGLILAGILPLSLSGLTLITLGQQVLTQQSTRELTGLARGLSAEIELYVTTLLDDTRAIAVLPDIAGMAVDRQTTLLEWLFFEFTGFTRLSVFSLDGQRLASSHAGGAPLIEKQPSFQTAAQQGRQSWEVATSLTTGRRSLLIHTPIRNAERQVTGVLRAVVDLANLANLVARTEIGGGGRAVVLDGAGQALIHPEQTVMMNPDPYAWPGLTGASYPAGPGTFHYIWRSQPYVASYAPVTGIGWIVVVEQPESEVLAPVINLRLIGLVALALSVTLALAVSIFIVRRLIQPLGHLASAAQAFGAGEADVPLSADQSSAEEITLVIAAFSDMRTAVSEAMQRERSERALNEAILASVPTGLLVVSSDLQVFSANKSLVRLTGVGVTASTSLDHALPDEELRERIAQAVNKRLAATDLIVDSGQPRRLLRVFITPIGVEESPQGDRWLVGLEDLTEIAQIRLRYRMLETLQQISNLILGSVDLKVTLQQILERTLALGPFDVGLVRLQPFDQTADGLLFSAGFQNPPQGSLVAGLPAHLQEIHRSVSPDAFAALPDFQREEVCSALIVPMRAGGEIFGSIELGSRTKHAFADTERELLETVSSQVGLAVQKARLDDALRKSEAEARLLSLVASRTDNAVIITDRLGLIEWVNEGFTRITGYILEEVQGRTPGSILQGPESDREVIAYMRKHITEGSAFNCEIINYHKTGRIYWIYIEGQPLYDQTGQVNRFMALESDITEQKRIQQALTAANAELEQALLTVKRNADKATAASSAKSEFLSRMSHELRTPLNAILGFAQILEDEELPAAQAAAIQQILQAGHYLLNLINEVLDLSRVEAGKMSLSLRPVTVSAAVREAVDMLRPIAAKGKIAMEYQIASAGTGQVYVDNSRFKQVLVNLLSNAIKYNHPGGRIIVAVKPGESDKVRISITDTGRGIAPDKMQRLFMPFDRLDAETTRVEGTGLGLALSKRLMELMGGAIGAASVAGQGSVFWLDLPQSDACAVSNAALATEPIDKPAVLSTSVTYTVLYIEDNPANLQLVEVVLRRRQEIRLLSAMAGRPGLEMARKNQPDLILLDLHLPDLSGYEVLVLLKEHPATQHIPVVVVSADVLSQSTEQLSAAGASACIAKPLNIGKFLSLVDRLLANKAVNEDL